MVQPATSFLLTKKHLSQWSKCLILFYCPCSNRTSCCSHHASCWPNHEQSHSSNATTYKCRVSYTPTPFHWTSQTHYSALWSNKVYQSFSGGWAVLDTFCLLINSLIKKKESWFSSVSRTCSHGVSDYIVVLVCLFYAWMRNTYKLYKYSNYWDSKYV